jgi:hypothetical protein
MDDKIELEIIAKKEAYSFYKNRLNELLEIKDTEIGQIYKKLKILKKAKKEEEYKALKKKYDKEIISSQIIKEKIFILTEWLNELNNLLQRDE